MAAPTTTTTNNTTTTFPHFTDLPLDLQFEIWDLTQFQMPLVDVLRRRCPELFDREGCVKVVVLGENGKWRVENND